MTYGDHQEATADALLRLLNASTREHGPMDIGTVLACRHQIHLSILDRLTDLGLPQAPQTRRRAGQRMEAVHRPLYVLHDLVAAMPDAAVDDRSPSALLVGPTAEAGVTALWRTAARHLMLGNADLNASADPSWRAGAARWYVIADLANTAEALLVLDQRLAHEAHLPLQPKDVHLEARLTAGDVARVAGWRGTDTRADLAFTPEWTERSLISGPRVHLVRRPEDFASAQRRLAGFMRPRQSDDLIAEFDGRPGLLAARTVAVGQVRLAETFATWAEQAGDDRLAERFRARIPRYAALHRSTLRMTELQKVGSPLVVMQQSEIVQRLRAHSTLRLSPASLCDLDAASVDVAVNTGKSLRREAMTCKNILVIDTERIGLPGARPVTNSRHHFIVACRDLAAEQADPAEPVGRGNRLRLTSALIRVSSVDRSSIRAPLPAPTRGP